MESLQNQGLWSKKSILRLLDRMQNHLLSNDNPVSQTTPSHLDWEKIAFQNFSGEMCKLKWTEISSKVGNVQPLKESVLAARELALKHRRHQEYKKYPDFPKRPLTAYIRFYMEQRTCYSQKHPELNNQELTKNLAEKYGRLPQEIKQKYIEAYRKDKRDYEEKLVQFRKKHPDPVQNSKTLGGPQRLHQTSAPKKIQGNVERGRSLSKTDGFCKKEKFHTEPKKPPMNGYHKFHQDSWSSEELSHLPLRERLVEIGRRWQRVPQSLKEQYKKQAEELQQQYRLDLDLWLRTLSPEEYAAYKERSYGKGKIMTVAGAPHPIFVKADRLRSPAKPQPEGLGKENGLQALGGDPSGAIPVSSPCSQESEREMKADGEADEGSHSWHSSGGEEHHHSSSSSLEEPAAMDII
nr:upstream-binding factor 1-like protein 1 [Cavia porcellus]XP_003468623.1 upstream-binding factor 1-like protein 1 [Cavia porcellus]